MRSEYEETALYARALGINMPEAQELICQQRIAVAGASSVEPHQQDLALTETAPAAKKTTRLELYAQAMGITKAEAADRQCSKHPQRSNHRKVRTSL